jgi:4'-phosphopantetheinyl transferase EntD
MCSAVRTDGPLARLLADERIKVAEVDPDSVTAGAGLFPEEARAVAHAVESRRRQFTAGRLLARRAWRDLGVPPLPLVNDEQHVPRWPEGVVGTITHTHGWCASAVALATQIEALGADVEAATPLDPALWERICRPEERRWLERHESPAARLLAKAFFSAKESVYKALFPSVRAFLDFQAMRIEFSLAAVTGSGCWQAVLQVPWGPFSPGRQFGPGGISIDSAWIVTGLALPRTALSER